MSMRNVHNDSDREAWIGIQRKTFTRWANQYLSSEQKINELVTDLSSGIVLTSLLERISEEKVGRVNKNPKMDIQKLENLNQCLTFIRNHDIPLVNIGSSDILKGNEKLILGLLWTIILRFEVSGADGKAGLLLWLQRSTKGYGNVDVKDFTSSWKDGLAFNALIHRYRPDLLEYDTLNGTDGLGNCGKAFGIAENDLGIAKLLDPEDVVAHPDEKSMVAYLSQFFKKFAGQAKLESKLKAIRNAVQVTRKHDEWMNQYNEGSKQVLDFASSKKSELEGYPNGTTTEEVKNALDSFSSYMKETKPVMASKRAEVEGIYTTLTSSKRNNKRPEFNPEIDVTTMNQTWEELEQFEQSYERQILDRYLAYQTVDRCLAQFNAKSTTVNTWLDEKISYFQQGDLGTSVPDIEAKLEMQSTFENRYKLYEQVVQETKNIVAKATVFEGHCGIATLTQGMEELEKKMLQVQTLGQEFHQQLQEKLQQEKYLVEKEKEYLHKIETLDFSIDQLEEKINEDVSTATSAELKELDSTSFESQFSSSFQELEQVINLAKEIESKQPNALPHCEQQKQRMETLQTKSSERKAKLAALIEEGEKKDQLSKGFAQLANVFAEHCASQRQKLGGLSGDIQSQKSQLEALRKETPSESSKLDELQSAYNECEQAKIVANPYTPHTIFSLRAQYDQLIKQMKSTDDELAAQIIAQQSLEIPPEQLKEMQEIFSVFDTDHDGILHKAELREACLGAGIDLEDSELEERMKKQKSNMLFTLDDFVAFFIEEVKSGDTEDDVIDAFKTISSGGTISDDQIQSTFTSINPELAQYLSQNIANGDFVSFTHQLFSR